MKLDPMYDRILVEKVKTNQTHTDSGLILPENMKQDHIGRVLAVGAGHRVENSSDLIPLRVTIGDLVFYDPRTCIPWRGGKDNKEVYILPESGVIGIVIEKD